MADYFTNFSVVVPLPDDAALEYAVNLHHQAMQGRQGEQLPADFPAELKEAAEWWDFETEPGTFEHQLWLHSQNGGVDAVCAFIQHLLQRFNPQGRVGFEWSNDCSKPRTDAYGGGAAMITATEIKSFSTAQWLAENAG